MKKPQKPIWYYQDNGTGYKFWDSYLHRTCTLVETSHTDPFESPNATNKSETGDGK